MLEHLLTADCNMRDIKFPEDNHIDVFNISVTDVAHFTV